MGELLKELDLVPDLIISSDVKRAKDTAKAVSQSFGYDGRIELNPSLYTADSDAYLEALRPVPDNLTRVLIVGHNPALEELVLLLTKKTEPLPTCALAQINLEIAGWSDLGRNTEGHLISIWRPREL
jgi:phosphohistidine phosphatase